MVYVALLFGIFGLVAYVEQSALKKRIQRLEQALAGMNGTAYAEERKSVAQMVQSCLGKRVLLSFKEDFQDIDLFMAGPKYGTCVLRDADEEWVLVHAEFGKKVFDKLIRLDAIKSVSIVTE